MAVAQGFKTVSEVNYIVQMMYTVYDYIIIYGILWHFMVMSWQCCRMAQFETQ